VNKIELKISDFVEKFPSVELPVVLNEDSVMEFSRINLPLSELDMIAYIHPFEEDVNEFTEFIPCLSIPETHDFHALVYWRGDLLKYHFTMITFDKNGKFLDKKVIGGTYSNEDVLYQAVTTIDEDWIIYVVTGQTQANQKDYDPTSSKISNLELLADGKIISS